VIRKTLATLVWTAILLASYAVRTSGAPPQNTERNTPSGPVICSVMETFDDAKLGVRAVIFHQRDKADGPRLGELLLAHTGEEMELQTTSGHLYRAPVFRVKSAFGRGLVLIPPGKFTLAAHDQFTLRVPGKN